MKKIFGITKNINSNIICRIISIKKENRESLFYSTQCIKNNEISKGLTIVYQKHAHLINQNDEHFVILKNDESPIEVGDILSISTTGEASIIFEKKVISNSIFPTERCNSKCIMCPQPSKRNFDYIDVSIDTIALLDNDVQSIGITGGEPTINWNGLMKIFQKCSVHIPDAVIYLLTNARLLKDYQKVTELSNNCQNSLQVLCWSNKQ